MLNVTVLCVGRLKEKYWQEACREYEKRMGAFCRLRIVEVAEERLPDNPSPAQIAATVDAEGKRLLELLPRDAATMALCIEGTGYSSPALAEKIRRWTVEGCSHVCFVIGGSYGLSDAVKSQARLRLSMSPMTFPHQLARVLLLEQLYRCCQINGGGKYHK